MLSLGETKGRSYRGVKPVTTRLLDEPTIYYATTTFNYGARMSMVKSVYECEFMNEYVSKLLNVLANNNRWFSIFV